MILELYKLDTEFLITLLDMTHVMALIRAMRHAMPHPENNEFILWELDYSDAEELLGQLAFEANHCTNKKMAKRINEIADQVECQI